MINSAIGILWNIFWKWILYFCFSNGKKGLNAWPIDQWKEKFHKNTQRSLKVLIEIAVIHQFSNSCFLIIVFHSIRNLLEWSCTGINVLKQLGKFNYLVFNIFLFGIFTFHNLSLDYSVAESLATCYIDLLKIASDWNS